MKANDLLRNAVASFGHNLAALEITAIDRAVARAAEYVDRGLDGIPTEGAYVRRLVKAGIDDAFARLTSAVYPEAVYTAVRILPLALQALIRHAAVRKEAKAPATSPEHMLVSMFDRYSLDEARDLTARAMSAKDYKGARAKLSDRAARQASEQLAQGLAEGDSFSQIKARLIDVIGDRKGLGWDRLIQTELARATNLSFDDYVARNRDILGGVQYSCLLDTHTCPICGATDGQSYWFQPREGEHSYAHKPPVPQHPRCRCRYFPIVRDWTELPIDQTAVSDAFKRAFDGAPPAHQTYSQWFGERNQTQQRDILGPRRFTLFQSGWAVRQFGSGGKILTLAQLAKAGPEIAPVAGMQVHAVTETASEYAKTATIAGHVASISQRLSPLANEAGVQVNALPGDIGRLAPGWKRTPRRFARETAEGVEYIRGEAVTTTEASRQAALNLARATHSPWPPVITRGIAMPGWPERYLRIVQARGGYVEVLSAKGGPSAIPVNIHPEYAKLVTTKGRVPLTADESQKLSRLITPPHPGDIPAYRTRAAIGWLRAIDRTKLAWTPLP